MLYQSSSEHFSCCENKIQNISIFYQILLTLPIVWLDLQYKNELHYHFWQVKYSSKVITIDVQFWLNLGITMTQYQWKSWLSVSMDSSMEKN